MFTEEVFKVAFYDYNRIHNNRIKYKNKIRENVSSKKSKYWSNIYILEDYNISIFFIYKRI